MTANEISIEVHEDLRVSGLCNRPSDAKACLLLAHGAGVGMRHASMASLTDGLSERGIATLRYQFPYMEQGQGGRRPDPPSLCHATVRAAVAAAHALLPGLALFAGGRSFGGRMTSQAQARNALGGVKGLVFFAFPLHPAGKPGSERAAHLSTVKLPMLFLQGTRDPLAEVALLEPMISSLGPRAAVHWLEGADHSFHVPARSGRKDADVRDEMLDAAAAWIRSTH